MAGYRDKIRSWMGSIVTRPLRKCEREMEKAIFEIAEKYGFKDLGITGTIDPAYYKIHRRIPSTGMSVSFIDDKIQ